MISVDYIFLIVQKPIFLNLLRFFKQIETKEFFDIFLTAFIFYLVLLLFRRTKTLVVFLGLLFIVILFGVSILFSLTLTYRILQAFFGAFVIILTIIFQSEIRRFFELLGGIGFRKKIHISKIDTLDLISNTVFKMAKEKIGALIIFPGKESIEQYIIGGKILNGEISEEILLSIFDVHSPGHDGAVIIEDEKILKFSVYLPLSEDIFQLEKYGTRHRAALGISEKTDCLCIVVSEEKGIVNIVRFGKMKKIDSKEELKKELSKFLGLDFPKTIQGKIKKFVKNIWREIYFFLFAILSSSLLWFVINYPTVNNVQKSFILPVEIINIPDNLLIDNIKPLEVIGTFSGKSQDFEFISNTTLKIVINTSQIQKIGIENVKLDRENVRYGNDNRRLPAQISLIKLEPNYIQLKIKTK